MRAHLFPLLSLLCACAAGSGSGGGPVADAACPTETGRWMVPATGRAVSFTALLDDLAGGPAVILGESHTSAEDHRWQLHTLAALHGRRPDLVIGFEAFPRRLQTVLDRWVAGELDERAFLEQVEWDEVWGFPAALYMPLFDFARMHRIPMVALNVERSLVARVGKEGWDAVPAAVREGVGTPAAPGPAYVAALGRVYGSHRGDQTTDLPPATDDPAFRRFVEAQTTWDRAMAEAIAAAHRRPGRPQVVAIVGRGHVEYGFGIPHQLAALGLPGAAVLLTWPAGRDCAELVEDGVAVADAVFAVADEPEGGPQGPRLGVRLGTVEGGVHIDEVTAGSVAEAAGLKVGDVIREAAGLPVRRPGELAAAIRRQPFGTWLPLRVHRGDETLEVVAKFPARPHPPMAGPNPHRRDGQAPPP